MQFEEIRYMYIAPRLIGLSHSPVHHVQSHLYTLACTKEVYNVYVPYRVAYKI